MHSDILHNKFEATKSFVDLVMAKAREKIYAIYLFGSVAKGTADIHSDIDVLIIAYEKDDELYDVLSSAAFEVFQKTGESIEFLVFDFEEAMRSSYASPFFHEVKRYGKLLYLNGGRIRERAEALLRLSEHYRSGAYDLKRLGYYRIALDTLYNALELLIKALILMEEKPLPKTHGGYLHLFGQLYVRTGVARNTLLRDLHKCLDARNKARYDPDAEISISDIEFVENIYEEMRELLIARLKKETNNAQ
ncbi:MAG: HEPN domain-containing protein [Candidatus Njordarchaeota archaeon]